MHPIQRAIATSLIEFGYLSQSATATILNQKQYNIFKMIIRVKVRAEELGLTLLDPEVYEDAERRNRKEILSTEQKAEIQDFIT